MPPVANNHALVPQNEKPARTGTFRRNSIQSQLAIEMDKEQVNLERIFNKYDRDGSGFLTSQEMCNVFGRTGLQVTYQDAEDMFVCFNKNNAGHMMSIGGYKKIRDLLNGHADQYAEPEEEEEEEEEQQFGDTLFTSAAGRRLPAWRQKLGGKLESGFWEKSMLLVLLLDILIFFVRLLILEDAFGQNDRVHDIEEILEVTSIAVLAIFCVDIVLMITAAGFLYFRHLGYVIDFFVVPAALVLELTLGSLGGFLVIFRVWRVLRVLGKSAAMTVGSAIKKTNRLERALGYVAQAFTRVSDVRVFKDARVNALNNVIRESRGGREAAQRSLATDIDETVKFEDAVGERTDKVVFDEDGNDERAAMEKAFKTWDLDGDDVITEDEVRSMLQRTHCGFENERVAGVMRMMDLNGTGAIEKEDFLMFRRMFNGRFKGQPDDLLEAGKFEDSLQTLRHNVKHVMLDKNEAPELHQHDDNELVDERKPWRKDLERILDSDMAMAIMTALLVLDLIRFFLYLLVLEDIFGDKPWSEGINDFKHSLDITSIVILSIFTVEIAAMLIALGPGRFFKSKGLVTDLVIIPLSLVLEATFGAFGGFLVFVRMWRMMRIMTRVTNAKQNHLFAKEKILNDQLTSLQTNFERAAARLEESHWVESEKLATVSELRARAGIADEKQHIAPAAPVSMQDHWEDTWDLFMTDGARNKKGKNGYIGLSGGSPIGRGLSGQGKNYQPDALRL